MEAHIADTFGLAQYSYEVDQLPRLTPEETAALGKRILQANQGQIDQAEGIAARDAIIKGHLYLVLSLAQRYPYDVREDLIQEGNLGLIDAVEQYSFHSECDFTLYAIVAIRHAFTDAMESALPIRIPRTSLRAAKAAGTADQLYAMQPTTLDRPLLDDEESSGEESSLADTLPVPHIMEASVASQKHTHASVDELLDTLPSIVRLVIELRYGLAEYDQRQHSYAQVAEVLGISKSFASKLEQQGLAILGGKQQHPDQLRQQAQESRLNAAYALLRQSHQRISSHKLAKAAKVRGDVAVSYLQHIMEQSGQNEQIIVKPLGEKIYTKLLHAYRQLQEQDVPITPLALTKATGSNWNTAKKFLDYRAQLAAQRVELTDMHREAVEA